MPNAPRERRTQSAPVLMAWDTPAAERRSSFAELVGLWAGGGVMLLAWTGLALLLTS